MLYLTPDNVVYAVKTSAWFHYMWFYSLVFCLLFLFKQLSEILAELKKNPEKRLCILRTDSEWITSRSFILPLALPNVIRVSIGPKRHSSFYCHTLVFKLSEFR